MQNDDKAAFVDRVLSQLQDVPPWSGVSYRGMPQHVSFGTEVRSAVSTGLIATSRDPRVATENFTSHGLFAIVGSHGRGIESISQFPHEKEVVFLPSTVFSFVATASYEEMPIVIVRQVDLGTEREEPVNPQDLGRRVGAAVRAAKEGAAVPITSPDKYVGDLD